jgi:hypothetical protein
MEKDGLIKRAARFDSQYGGQKTNTYHFDGLIEKLKPYAEEIILSRTGQKAEEAARRTRKRPLTIVKTSEE